MLGSDNDEVVMLKKIQLLEMAVKHVEVKYDVGDLKGFSKENIKEGMDDIHVTKQ